MSKTGKLHPPRHPTTTFASWCRAKDKAGWEHGAFIGGKCPKCALEEELPREER